MIDDIIECLRAIVEGRHDRRYNRAHIGQHRQHSQMAAVRGASRTASTNLRFSLSTTSAARDSSEDSMSVVNRGEGGKVSIPLHPRCPVRTQKVKLLGVSSEKRSPIFSDVPTISETIPNFTFTSWVGYFAPAGNTPQIVKSLSSAVSEICQQKGLADTMAQMGMTAVCSTLDYVAAAIQTDLLTAKSAVEAAGLSQ